MANAVVLAAALMLLESTLNWLLKSLRFVHSSSNFAPAVISITCETSKFTSPLAEPRTPTVNLMIGRMITPEMLIGLNRTVARSNDFSKL